MWSADIVSMTIELSWETVGWDIFCTFFLLTFFLYGDISEPKEDRECSPTNKRFDTSDKLLVVAP